MNRRGFVQTTALGALGLYHTPGIGQIICPSEQWQTWLNEVIINCGVKEIAGWRQLDVALSKAASELLSQADWKGFYPHHARFYFYHGTYAFTVVEKLHEAIGLKEIALPLWSKQADGKWKYVMSLSIFQLEATAKACKALAAKYPDNTMSQYLLPIERRIQKPLLYPGDYQTTRGWVSVTPTIKSSRFTVELKIAADDQLILTEYFASAYCLTCQA